MELHHEFTAILIVPQNILQVWKIQKKLCLLLQTWLQYMHCHCQVVILQTRMNDFFCYLEILPRPMYIENTEMHALKSTLFHFKGESLRRCGMKHYLTLSPLDQQHVTFTLYVNMPLSVKSLRLRQAQEHLDRAHTERSHYNSQCKLDDSASNPTIMHDSYD